MHIRERAETQTEPHNVTNSYVWTMKINPPSTNPADLQTIRGNPFFVGFCIKHKEIRGDVWTTVSANLMIPGT